MTSENENEGNETAPVPTPAPVPALDEVRPFNLGSRSLNAAAQRAVDALPPGNSSAILVSVAANGVGAQLSIAGRSKSGAWTYIGIIDKQYRGELTGLVQVRRSW